MPKHSATSSAPSSTTTSPTAHQASDWDVSHSKTFYQICGWGAPYFDVNARGNVTVRPSPSDDQRFDLHDIVEKLHERGLEFPMLLRFPNILEHRIDLINESFQEAIRTYAYQSAYRGVFPIKVNQQRHLIDDLVKAGKRWSYGLEAGSKPELLIALAAMTEQKGFIICNGYKDRAFIETALIAQRFDNTVIIVLERQDELDIVLEASKRLGIRPQLGIRSKLASKGMGRWAESAGDRAKFGLTTPQIIRVVHTLAKHDMLDCLRLLHFHIGSQVSSIEPWNKALREAGNIYGELVKMGCKMGYIDVGGGLAVDYDGSQSDFHASMNYDVQEYANGVVSILKAACDHHNVAHPTIVTESGRAVASYQSVLVFEAIGESSEEREAVRPREDAPPVLRNLWKTYETIHPEHVQQSWHAANTALEDARERFRLGIISLEDLGHIESLHRCCIRRIHERLQERDHVPRELEHLDELLGNIYYCNFSLFQSAPDIWAMEQLFPIMPIHRLDEKPNQKARLADLTCDSDGIIETFIHQDGVQQSLALHPIKPGQRYLLGMFLVGAYQEILGDLHNLFGDTHAIHIKLKPNGKGYAISDVIKGDTISEVLGYVQYDVEKMIEAVRQQAEDSLEEGKMNIQQMRRFMKHYEESLRGYTYLRTSEED